MTGSLLRFSEAEIEQLRGMDPEEQYEHVDALPAIEDEQGRSLYLDKSWDIIRNLYERSGLPSTGDPIETFGPAGELAIDWDGFGFFDPDQVRVIAETLADVTFARLRGTTTLEELAEADVYCIGGEDEEFSYAKHHFENLAPFYAAAARAGHYVLVDIN